MVGAEFRRPPNRDAHRPLTQHFTDQLAAAVRRLASPVVVGLDPRWEQLPDGFRAAGDDSLEVKAQAFEAFCNGVVDVVAPLVPAVKVQAAFFEELGPAGMTAMAAVIDHARERGLLVIVDGKRNDIGSTAEAYARGYLGRVESAWHADALTVSPYLGDDSLTPFVDVAAERGAGVFVLVKTSNPGSGMLQDLRRRRRAALSPRGRSTSSSWRARRSASVDTAASARWSGQPIRSNWPSCGPRCRTRGFWCPATAARAARRPTLLLRSTLAASARSSTTRAALSSPMRARSMPTASARRSGRMRSTPRRGR